jgi:hypothetical protein
MSPGSESPRSVTPSLKDIALGGREAVSDGANEAGELAREDGRNDTRLLAREPGKEIDESARDGTRELIEESSRAR